MENRFSLKHIFVFFLLILFNFYLSAQDWESMMGDDSFTFQEIQAAFYASAPDGDITKINGWKQFKRWEYYNKYRLNENGKILNSGYVLKEVQKYYREHPQSRSYDSGSGKWQEHGPVGAPLNGTSQPNGNGRISCIAFHPTDANTLYAGTPGGGFWKSTDGGASWTKYVTGLVRLGVSTIVVHPTNPDIIYIGTGDRDARDTPGYGVWKSSDGGLTWSNVSSSQMQRAIISRLVMHPTNPNTIIGVARNYVYRTTDGGATWTSTYVSEQLKDIVFHPTDPSIVYVSGTYFHKSTNEGQSFTRINSVPSATRLAIGVSESAPNTVYVLAGGSPATGTFKGLYKSTDSGANFTLQSNTPNILGRAPYGTDRVSQAWYDLAVAVDPNDANTLYAGGINIWKSTDGGISWTIAAHWLGGGGVEAVHADHHEIVFSPHDNTIYNGNDGGVFKSTNGSNWVDITGNIAVAQVYKIGVSQQTKDLVINGYQDNGTAVFYGENGFQTTIGGDGMECIIDPTDDNYLYGSLYYGDIRRRKDNETYFSRIAGNGINGITEQGDWVTPFKLDPNNPATMFAGYRNIWRSTNVKAALRYEINFTNISSGLGINGTGIDLAIAPSNSNILYYSTNDYSNRFVKTTNALDASPTFTNLTSSLPSGYRVVDIEIDPVDPNHLFIVMDWYGSRVYESHDGGLNWTNITGSLPSIPASCLVIDRTSSVNGMYIGMDAGVYYRDNNSTDWELYSTGLPNVEVRELEIHYGSEPCDNQLYAATYGRGLWSSDLKDVLAIPKACFEVERSGCNGDKVKLMNNSVNSPQSFTWQISPNSFSFINGTDANSENPEIEFENSGAYTISLTASNSLGSETKTKSEMITIATSSEAILFDEDFESVDLCLGDYNCDLSCSISNFWTNISTDAIDWRINEGATISFGTGPSTDYSEGTATGNYAYVQSSGCIGAIAILESSCITIDQPYTWKLAYHMYGLSIGSLHFDIEVDGKWYNDFVTPIVGNQGDLWHEKSINLGNVDIPLSPEQGGGVLTDNETSVSSSVLNKNIKLRLRAVTGIGSRSDIAIDAISFEALAPLPTDLLSFEANCQKNGVNVIQWTTENNDLDETFELEKLNERTNTWELVERIPVVETQTTYEVEHTAKEVTNYYRLATVNLNGTKQYSKIVVTSCKWENDDVKIYPNPFSENLTIEVKSQISMHMPYKVMNMLRQEVARGVLELEVGDNKLPIEMSQLSHGMYLIQLEGDSNSKIYQVVKQ